MLVVSLCPNRTFLIFDTFTHLRRCCGAANRGSSPRSTWSLPSFLPAIYGPAVAADLNNTNKVAPPCLHRPRAKPSPSCAIGLTFLARQRRLTAHGSVVSFESNADRTLHGSEETVDRLGCGKRRAYYRVMYDCRRRKTEVACGDLAW